MKISIASLLVLFLLCAPSEWAAFGQAAGARGAASSDDAQLERLFLDAELLLDSERKPKEAAKLFRKVWKDRDAPRVLKAEALAGLIRCERLLGNDKKANSLLRELIDDFGDLPAVSQEILCLSTGAPGASFLSGIEVVDEGRFLDLDTGGVITAIRSGSGSAPELVVRNKEVVFLTSSREDKAMANLAQKIYDAPWHRVNTDLGRTAWVQIVRTRESVSVRFFTALSGTQTVLPAPRNLFCVGTGRQIEVHFEESDIFSSYRVERQDSVTEPFQILKSIRQGPFEDRNVAPGNRYVYKISGIAANKAESLPVTVDGTTNSLGVLSGSVVLEWSTEAERDSFDFLTGRHARSGGDITVTGTYGGRSSASFADCFGVHAQRLPGVLDSKYPNWGKQIPPHAPFQVYLRGGGVARCIWKPEPDGKVIVDYEVNPDASHLDHRPIVTVDASDRWAAITIAAPEGYKADGVTVTDAADGGVRFLAVKNGEARDRDIEGKKFLTYSAACVDRFGRRSARGSAFLNLSPKGIRKGEFQFHYDQAYSIELERLVAPDGGDVHFADSAGGISAVKLLASEGIINLEWGRRSDSMLRGCSTEQLLDAILSFDPAAGTLETRARGDSREPHDDVFIVRTRYGGWAKFAIVARADQGSWKERLVTIRYIYNAHEPIFREDQDVETVTEHGVTLDLKILNKSREMVTSTQREILADLDRRAAEWSASLAKETGKDVQVDGLVSRSHAWDLGLPDDYRISTFNFTHATRDDTELVRNDWDIMFYNGDPQIGVFDMSSIWDLGTVAFDDVVIADGHSHARAEKVPANRGNVYVIHSLDRETDLWIKMEILDLNSGDWIIFRWEIIDDVEKVIRLERLPDLEMKAPVVNLQLRAGAGGGNPNRITMNGSTSAYVDVISDTPLDMTAAPNITEQSWCYFEGGFIPEGKVWIVKFIELMARTDGDTNGHGEFLLHLGPYTIAHLPKIYDSEKAVIYTIDGGVRILEAGEPTVNYSLAMDIPLWPGDEKNVFAEVANSSLCNVVIRGDFVDAKDCRGPRDRGVPALDGLSRYFLSVSKREKTNAQAALEQYARENRDLLPYLEKILDLATNDEYRALLERMIEAAEQ